MNRIKKKVATVVSLLLLLFFITVFALSVAAADNDMSCTGAGGNVTLTSSEIVEGYLGSGLSDAEKDFLDSFSKLTLSYNTIINTNCIKRITYSEGALYIEAQKFSYTTANGNLFEWAPSYAVIDGRKAYFSYDSGSEIYRLTLGSVTQEPLDGSEISVTYSSIASISKDDINDVLNLYHDTAKYSYDIKAYNEASEAYDEYIIAKLLYNESKVEWDKYDAALSAYNEAKAALEEYYNVTKPKYEADLNAYHEYEKERDAYEENYAKYLAYLDKLVPLRKHIEALKLIDVKMGSAKLGSLERTIYSAVMGGTVDQVLANESAIVAGGADENAVHLAGDATERVRTLMKGFKACKTEAEQYAFYVTNYDNLCKSFLELTQALDKLYRAKAVQSFIIASDKNEKYIILVAQLALISNALIDGEIRNYDGNIAYNDSWTIDGLTINEILGKSYFEDDDNAEPGVYPTEVAEPKMPDEVKKPVYQSPPTVPAEPKRPAVDDPRADGAPEEVNPPAEVTAPRAEILNIYRKLSASERSELIELFKNGNIPDTRRELTSSDLDASIRLETTFIKKYNAPKINLTFKIPVRNENGEIVEYESFDLENIDSGSPIVYTGRIPENYTDATGTYTFVGWKLENESEISDYDLENSREIITEITLDLILGFTEDSVLVPVYDRAPEYYNVTWNLNGETISERVISGVAPECPFEDSLLVKEDVGNVYYEFRGWRDSYGEIYGGKTGKVLPSLVEDSVYTALFDECYIVETVGFSSTKGALIEYEKYGNSVCDATYARTDTVDISKLLERIYDQKSSLTLKLQYGELNFTFTEIKTMYEGGVTEVGIDYENHGVAAKYKVVVLDADGDIYDIAVDGVFKNPLQGIEGCVLAAKNESSAFYASYTENGENILFEAESGTRYNLRREYYVQTVPSKYADISYEIVRFDPEGIVVNENAVTYRDVVYYNISVKEGMTVEKSDIIVENTDGTGVSYNHNGGIIVKYSDLTISVKGREKTYMITFVANGKVISQFEAKHGDEVTPPAAPALANDDSYSYSFTGWDKEITAAYSDTTYEAVYEKTPLPEKPDEGGLKLSPTVKKLFYVAVACISVIFVLIGTLITVLIVRKVKRGKLEED